MYLAYDAGQVHNRTIRNTLVNHNFCNSLSHKKGTLEEKLIVHVNSSGLKRF